MLSWAALLNQPDSYGGHWHLYPFKIKCVEFTKSRIKMNNWAFFRLLLLNTEQTSNQVWKISPWFITENQYAMHRREPVKKEDTILLKVGRVQIYSGPTVGHAIICCADFSLLESQCSHECSGTEWIWVKVMLQEPCAEDSWEKLVLNINTSNCWTTTGPFSVNLQG